MSALYLRPGLRVRIALMGPTHVLPNPIQASFSTNKSYEVLGALEHSIDGELWFILANDLGQIYRISNRHLYYEEEKTNE